MPRRPAYFVATGRGDSLGHRNERLLALCGREHRVFGARGFSATQIFVSHVWRRRAFPRPVFLVSLDEMRLCARTQVQRQRWVGAFVSIAAFFTGCDGRLGILTPADPPTGEAKVHRNKKLKRPSKAARRLESEVEFAWSKMEVGACDVEIRWSQGSKAGFATGRIDWSDARFDLQLSGEWNGRPVAGRIASLSEGASIETRWGLGRCASTRVLETASHRSLHAQSWSLHRGLAQYLFSALWAPDAPIELGVSSPEWKLVQANGTELEFRSDTGDEQWLRVHAKGYWPQERRVRWTAQGGTVIDINERYICQTSAQ